MQNIQPVTLNPGAHAQSARKFLKFYNIDERKRGFKSLRDILTAFSRLPYENLSKIVKLERDYTAPNRIRLPEEVMQGHARHRLGGTCFSLTFFLQSILVYLDFTCYPVIAHMSRMRHSHCALIIVRGTEHWLADPGYLLNQPMRLDKDCSRMYRTRTPV
ncbi:MAG: arylamine N-acetyltransferase [candidate division KSB1 bacterium]|nr:arylamine N-acetyltransferase [candidate division KSB1 bacterium]